MESGAISAGPWLGVISAIIMWTGFIIVLSMLKSFISQGVSMAVAEFMLRIEKDQSTREKICRWFANGREIESVLQQIYSKMKKEK